MMSDKYENPEYAKYTSALDELIRKAVHETNRVNNMGISKENLDVIADNVRDMITDGET